jgi:hypothetical protein
LLKLTTYSFVRKVQIPFLIFDLNNIQMKKYILHLATVVAISSVSFGAQAQQTLNVSGHSAKIDGMTFDYSIGEMTLVSTERASNLIVTQGVLQPGAGSTSSPTSDATLSAVDNPIKVYPNPTSHLVFVEMYETSIQEFTYNLYDATGKIVMSQKGQTQAGLNKLELNLQSLASGSYYLMMRKNDVNGQTQNYSYKIQKVN